MNPTDTVPSNADAIQWVERAISGLENMGDSPVFCSFIYHKEWLPDGVFPYDPAFRVHMPASAVLPHLKLKLEELKRNARK